MDVSRIATIPTMVIVGDEATTIPVGGSFTDQGATFTDEDGSVSVIKATDNPLDVSKPGFYSLRYEKHTVSGYSASALRVVLVTNVSASKDYSGTYVRTSNGQPMHVTKVGTGLYITDNVGGVAGNANFIFDTYFGQPDDNTLVVPLQDTPLKELACTKAELVVTATDTVIKWAVVNGSFGTAVRTFSRK